MNTIIILLVKKPINADYSALSEKLETNSKSTNFKIGDRVRIIKYKNIFNKGYIGNYILTFSMRVTEKRILLIL